MNTTLLSKLSKILFLTLFLPTLAAGCDTADRDSQATGTADTDADMDADADTDADADGDGDAATLNGFLPTTVSADYVLSIYNAWKTDWVRTCPDGSLRVEWDEAGKTVSEGIGYGMLLAAAWNDQTTFDGFLAYYLSHKNSNGLMAWKGSCGGNDDQGAAADADMDAAMALIIANCTWPGLGYDLQATNIINALRTVMLKPDGTHVFLCAGDTWGDDCCGNASYQAPAYYRAFGRFTGDTAYFDQVANDTYYYLNKYANPTTGLVPDWMDPDQLTCNAKDAGDWYGWDAARVPWRVTLDYVWWGIPEAQAYAQKIAAFVAADGGISQTADGYHLNGNKYNSDAIATFAGAFACTGMAVNQVTADQFFSDLVGVGNNGYFNQILNVLYFTTAAGMLRPTCL